MRLVTVYGQRKAELLRDRLEIELDQQPCREALKSAEDATHVWESNCVQIGEAIKSFPTEAASGGS